MRSSLWCLLLPNISIDGGKMFMQMFYKSVFDGINLRGYYHLLVEQMVQANTYPGIVGRILYLALNATIGVAFHL